MLDFLRVPVADLFDDDDDHVGDEDEFASPVSPAGQMTTGILRPSLRLPFWQEVVGTGVAGSTGTAPKGQRCPTVPKKALRGLCQLWHLS